MRNDTPYGGGRFRIKGNDVMSVGLANPEVTFKPTAESSEPRRPEPTEAWMNDTGELLNRMTISFFRGTIDGGMKRQFQQVGQNAAWWYSPDWSVQFLSTSWMNYKAPTHTAGMRRKRRSCRGRSNPPFIAPGFDSVSMPCRPLA
uniref:hypothetical protein n=1 Tax=Burkholderia anthina TaxID=179879 RepID=UPI001FC7D15B|nr:hypothetical protein [Burkholderia anthina]